ncbi:ImuA family protein [Rosistilla oblonga]|uniref:ImuA family protein n=1 Tax=Rosistilla oblonga TaxID=2527990 RepID=UPI003A9701DE
MSVQLQLWDEPAKTLAFPERKAQPPVGPPLAAGSAELAAAPPDTKTDVFSTLQSCSKNGEQDECQPPAGKADVLSSLRKQLRRVEAARRPESQAISSGIEPLDALLPQAGYPPGSLVEWIDVGHAGGAAWLSLTGAVAAHRHTGGKVVIVDTERTFYPPAAIAAGLPADAIVLLQPKSREDLIWSLDQSLRCSAVAAVWGRVGNLQDNDARRLQLAAETGATLGMLLRPATAIRQTSWAEVRWQVRGVVPRSAAPTSILTANSDRLLAVRLLRARGATAGQQLMLQIDQQSRIVRKELPRESKSAQHLAAELAHPKTARRQQSARRA